MEKTRAFNVNVAATTWTFQEWIQFSLPEQLYSVWTE